MTRTAEPDATDPNASRIVARRLFVAVMGLGLTQMIGWGTSFSAIAVLGTPIGANLGMAREVVFAGISVMLVVSALASPKAGRLLDRNGPRQHMAYGSLICAVALLVMALAQGPVSYLVSWALFGLALPFALTNAAVPAVVQIAGARARRAVTGLTIIGGVTSAVFLPLTAWLDGLMGWRLTLLLYAFLHLALALPTHLAVLPEGRPAAGVAGASGDAPWKGLLPAGQRTRAFWLIVLWSCFEGTLVWGFNMQAVDILRGTGLTLQAAIAVWMFAGPSQAVARVVEFALAGRYPIMVTALVSASLAPIGFAIVALAGFSVASATAMAICYGLGHGFFVIARSMLPLRLFGLETFGSMTGRLALPQNLANAVAPILFAALISRAGPAVAFVVSAVVATCSLISVWLLTRTIRGAIDAPPPA